MVDFGTTEDLGALVAELREAIDSGNLTPSQQSLYESLLGMIMLMRDARRSGVPDEITLKAMRRALDQIEVEDESSVLDSTVWGEQEVPLSRNPWRACYRPGSG